jgi:hypothetical protein
MTQAAPTQHPAVVLRSHYNHLRALLAVTILAVAGLTAAVVILATSDHTTTSQGSASAPSALTSQQEKRWSEYDKAIRALTPEQLAAAFGSRSVDGSSPRAAASQPHPTEK